jgi:hypothetical protein
MKRLATLRLIGPAGFALALLPCIATAQMQKPHPYRSSIVDMPISLAVGTVRTPPFAVTEQAYRIMVQVEKPLPYHQMLCMMGVTYGPLDAKGCTPNDPLLRAEWTVRDGNQVFTTGTSSMEADGKFTDKYIFKLLGDFQGWEGKTYTLEVKFTANGAALNVAHPHLLVVPEGSE